MGKECSINSIRLIYSIAWTTSDRYCILQFLAKNITLTCRQSFLCYTDGAIEPAKPDHRGGLPSTNGMVPHTCKDPSISYEKSLASHWSEEHLKAAGLQSRTGEGSGDSR
jgi:hypothetical protein